VQDVRRFRHDLILRELDKLARVYAIAILLDRTIKAFVSTLFRLHHTFPQRWQTTARILLVSFVALTASSQWSLAEETPRPQVTWRASHSVVPRCDRLPRKVLIGTEISGWDLILTFPLEKRFQRMDELVESMAAKARGSYPGKRLDLVVLTEYFLSRPGDAAAQRAVRLEEVRPRMAACAKKFGCYIVVPMVLKEEGLPLRYSNAAVLMDRAGQVAGIYRKVHPTSDQSGLLLEDGLTPGRDFPVFDCDFGRLGIEICYDINYAEGWAALAKQGAEIVALPSETSETIRPSRYAQEHRYYVVSATPKDHAAVYSPLGVIQAQATHAGVLVHEIDLSFEIVGYQKDGGIGLARKFGDRIGYNYYTDEDSGIFWSNDPTKSVRQMTESVGLHEMDEETERIRVLQDKVRGGRPAIP
jgi:predicted amidohydrolase